MTVTTQRFLYLLLCHVSSSGWSSVAPLVISGVGDSGTRAARKISTSIFKLSFCERRVNVAGDALQFHHHVSHNLSIAQHVLLCPREGNIFCEINTSNAAATRTLVQMVEVAVNKIFLCATGNNASKPRHIHWGFKNPRALYFYPLLHLIFPAIKLVLVIRDGRDIATGDNQYSFSSIGSFILNQEYLDNSSWTKQVKSRFQFWARVNVGAVKWAIDSYVSLFIFRLEDVIDVSGLKKNLTSLNGRLDAVARFAKFADIIDFTPSEADPKLRLIFKKRPRFAGGVHLENRIQRKVLKLQNAAGYEVNQAFLQFQYNLASWQPNFPSLDLSTWLLYPNGRIQVSWSDIPAIRPPTSALYT